MLSGIYLKGLWDKPIVTGMNQDRDTSLVQQFSFGNGIANTLQKDKNGRIVLAGNPKVGQTTLNYDSKQKQLEPESVKQTYSAQMGDTIHPQSGMSKQVRQVLDQIVYNQSPEPLFIQQVDVVEQISQTPEMDQWGRTVRQGDQHYQYDSQNRLVKITSTDETGQLIPVADYRYNTFNQRIAKTTYSNQGNQTKTTYYFYDGNQLIAETTDTAGQQADNLKQYVWLNDTPIAILQQGELYYIHTDHRNAPIAVTDNTSKLIWQADNEDFGYATINANSTFELNLRLSNQYYDSESGLHYNTNRYYNPETGRYLTSDPIGLNGGFNTYGYAGANPVNAVDPWGLYSVYWGGAGVANQSGYIADQVRSLKNVGIENVVFSIRGGSSWPIPGVGGTQNMLFDAARVNIYRRYDQSFFRDLVFDTDPDKKKFKCPEQTNYLGYSFGSLLAAHTAMYYAERGRFIDNVVLIASPINKDFLDKLKNHKNVIVKNLIDVGDPIYAGMTQFELVKGVPNLGADIAKDGEGHFYYSTDDKKGRQRRLKLALELYRNGIR